MFFFSTCSEGMANFTCPKCNTHYSIDEWNTDDYRPTECIEDIRCHVCDSTITVMVDIEVKYKVIE